MTFYEASGQVATLRARVWSEFEELKSCCRTYQTYGEVEVAYLQSKKHNILLAMRDLKTAYEDLRHSIERSQYTPRVIVFYEDQRSDWVEMKANELWGAVRGNIAMEMEYLGQVQYVEETFLLSYKQVEIPLEVLIDRYIAAARLGKAELSALKAEMESNEAESD